MTMEISIIIMKVLMGTIVIIDPPVQILIKTGLTIVIKKEKMLYITLMEIKR